MKKCATCDQEFSSTGSLKRHIKRIHDKDKRCKVCNNIFIPKTSEVTCSKVCQKEQSKRRVAIKMQDPVKREASRATKKRWKDKTRHLRNKYDDLNKQNRQCIICQKEYIGHIQSTTCSKECKLINKNQVRKASQPPKVEVFKDCEHCNEPFKVFHKKNKFCSDVCSHRHRNPLKPKYIERNCEECNRPFEAYLRRGKYCSVTCSNKRRTIRWNKNNPIQPKDCLCCGETFTPSKRSEVKYCSNICLKRHWKERNPTPTIEKEERACVICLTLFKTARLTGTTRQITCSNKCKNVKASQDRGERNKQIIPCEICNAPFRKIGNKNTCSEGCKLIKKRATSRKWFRDNPVQIVSQRISRNVRHSLKGIKKHKPTFEILDYSREDLIRHLESYFTEENCYTWDNIDEWHIDHIRPVSSFNFDSTDHPDFKKCWALSNLQPLWAEDNIRKSDTWDGEDS